MAQLTPLIQQIRDVVCHSLHFLRVVLPARAFPAQPNIDASPSQLHHPGTRSQRVSRGLQPADRCGSGVAVRLPVRAPAAKGEKADVPSTSLAAPLLWISLFIVSILAVR
jgi:hypothetical protein